MSLFRKNKSNYFYDSFTELMKYSIKEVEVLKQYLTSYKYDNLNQMKEEMHHLEHDGDVKKKEIMRQLVKEFITPIDREDILELLNSIDDLTDTIEEISLKMFIHDVKTLPSTIPNFLELLSSITKEVENLLKHFPHIHEEDVMAPLIDNINVIEEQGDILYQQSIKALYKQTDVTFLDIKNSENIINDFENAIDASRDVGKVVLKILYKNI